MKGAMNAVMTDGILHAKVEEMDTLSPAALLTKLNNVLKTRIEQDMNVTMVIGQINAETRTLTLANAGHHAHPLLARDGEVQPIKARGMPPGMRAGVRYREEQFSLQTEIRSSL
jgi:serine phosphatase RsbU (regulator of sigma subunit)